MPTTSISKGINIKTKKEAEALIRVLEEAEENATESKPLSMPYKEIKGKEIERFFSNYSEGSK